MSVVDEIRIKVMSRGTKWKRREAYRLIEVHELHTLITLARQTEAARAEAQPK